MLIFIKRIHNIYIRKPITWFPQAISHRYGNHRTRNSSGGGVSLDIYGALSALRMKKMADLQLREQEKWGPEEEHQV